MTENEGPEPENAGSQSTPPTRAEPSVVVVVDSDSEDEPSPSSHPLLQKLNLRAKWRERRKGKGKLTEKFTRRASDRIEAVEEAVDDDDSHVIVEDDTDADSESYMTRSDSVYLEVRYSRLRRLWNGIRKFLPAVNLSFVPLIGYHHVLMSFSAIAMVLLSLLIAGCSSHRMRGIYLLSLSYQTPQNSTTDSVTAAINPSLYSMIANISSTGDLAVRVGYFGICISNSGETPPSWTCRPKVQELAQHLNTTQDPLNLLAIGDNYQDQVILSVIIILATVLMFLGFYALSTFPGWHEETNAEGEDIEVKPFPSQLVSHMVLAFDTIAALFLLVAVLWQHVAAVAHAATTEAAFNGAIKSAVGTVAMGLGWGAIGANIVVVIGVCVMILSIRLLSKMTDDEEE